MISAVALDPLPPDSGATFERLKSESSATWNIELLSAVPLHLARVRISLAQWLAEDANLLEFDRELHAHEDAQRDICLVVEAFEPRYAGAVRQVLTRYQRLLTPISTPQSALLEILRHHRRMFDLSKPLVRADYDHAIDTWHWLMRLHPKATLALQTAALFHDIERLESEPDERIEQHAPDYLQFKRRHARNGSIRVASILSPLNIERDVVSRAADLIKKHEQPSSDSDVTLLNDADGLSFFSLNSWGFCRYFGRAHTEIKVRYTLMRMSHRARTELRDLRHPPLVAEVLDRVTHELS